MDEKMFKKLKKVPAWKVEQERDELMQEQKRLREETEMLKTQLENSRKDEILALKSNNGAVIAALEREIEGLEKKIKSNDETYKNNTDLLETYSKVLKNDREGEAAARDSKNGVIIGLVGAGCAIGGLIAAYVVDEKGLLVNKKTFEWAKSLVARLWRR